MGYLPRACRTRAQLNGTSFIPRLEGIMMNKYVAELDAELDYGHQYEHEHQQQGGAELSSVKKLCYMLLHVDI